MQITTDISEDLRSNLKARAANRKKPSGHILEETLLCGLEASEASPTEEMVIPAYPGRE